MSSSPPPAVVEAVFVPNDPPRNGVLALWGNGRTADDPWPSGVPDGKAEEIELVLAAGSVVRRRRVTARLIDLPLALPWLVGLGLDTDLSPSVAAWATAAKLGTQLVARGRLVPASSAAGWDTWRVGPLDPADADRLTALAAAFPPAAHALAVAAKGPLRVRTPAAIIHDLWDATADCLVRSPAAHRTVANPAFAAAGEPVDVGELAEWLALADRAIDAGSRPGLRLEWPEGHEDDGRFHAVVQVRSTLDPSLVLDASELWDAPPIVLSRMGDTVDTDLFVALRRGARAWPPLARLLDEARPEVLELDDDEVSQLLGSAAEALGGAGMEVLWPSGLADGGLSLRAVASHTEAPAPVTKAMFGMDGLLEFSWEVALGDQALSADEVAALAEAKRPMVRVRGQWVTVDPTLLEKLRRQRPRRLSPVETIAAALAGEITVDGEAVAFRVEGQLAEVASRLRRLGEAAGDTEPPPGLNATLRPYQRRGLAWLTEMCELGVGGCLADDMGLGKTIQVIALHLALQARGHNRPMLVVCPTSLLGNWEREIHRFAPGVPVRRFHGGERHLDELAPDEVVLVTYGVVRRDPETLAEVQWGVMVADEAQHVKNPLSRTARELRMVPAGARVALTGTPVENRLTELWAILDWTTPGLLGPLDGFRREVAMPIERYRDEEATDRLARIVRPFLLRRRKTDPGVAPELPPKTETDVIVPLTVEQATLYEAVVREAMAAIETSGGIQRRGLVFKLLTGLKQICNHPAQYLHQPGPLDGRSGKLAALDELLEVIVDAGDSVLVFTQYVQMATLIERHLAERNIATLMLTGRVSVPKRDEMVARFQAGEVPVFLLSLKAGGTGLNLTQATHVVHYDRWWNPAVEDQASDRAYRIGQDRPVQVHRLVTEGTLEDKIAVMLEAKRDLAERVIGSGEAWISELSDGELADLVAIGDAS